MLASTITPSTFDSFGKSTYHKIKQSEYNHFIEDLCDFNKNTYNDQFKNYCQQIMNNNMESINAVVFSDLLFRLTNTNHDALCNIFIEIFTEETHKIHNILNQSFNDNTFVIEKFMTLYKEYFKKGYLLKTKLQYFINNTQITTAKKTYSLLNLYTDYIFYNNIINRTYKYNNQQSLYLYEIFTIMIDMNAIGFEHMLPLFKMYMFYTKLSYVPSDKSLFNKKMEKTFIVNLGDNKEFIQRISLYIHNSIKELSNIKFDVFKISKVTDDKLNITNTVDDDKYNNVMNLLTLVSYLTEKTLFNTTYEKLLESRLLAKQSSIAIEKAFVSMFKKQNNNIYFTFSYKIDDIIRSDNNQSAYERITVDIQPTRVNPIKQAYFNQLDRKIMNIKTLRYQAWNESKTLEFETIELPNQVVPYIDIFNSFYQIRYPHRKLKWNFNIGTAVIQIKLGDTEYQFEVTTPQMLFLLQFSGKNQLTAKEIAENMKITLNKLSPLLNIMLKARIIKKHTTTSNDPNMILQLNHDFKYGSSKISLVALAPKN